MQTGSSKAARSVQNLEDSLDSVGKTSGSVGRAVAGVFTAAAATAAVSSAVRTFASFQQAMITVQAVSGASAQQLERLEKTARTLGATTRFSATEAAEGLLFLARAGFTVEQQISSLPSTLDLASAGALGLGDAADYASNILTAFNLQAEEMNRVTDTLVNTANSSNTSVQQMAEAMKFAAPTAAGLGQSIETTAAAIGVLGDSGIQGAMAGTNLRQVMLTLINPTKTARETIKEMGLTLDELSPTSNSLVTILQRLGDANLTTERAVKLFNTRTQSSAVILTNAVEKVRDLTEANKEAGGEANRVASEMSNNLIGAFRSLLSAADELKIVLIEGIAPSLREIIDTTADVILVMAGMDSQFIKNEESARRIIRWIDLLKTAAAALVALQLARWAAAVAASFKALAIASATNPFVAMSLAISSAIAGLILLQDELLKFEDGSVRVGSLIEAQWISIRDSFELVAVDLANAVRSIFDLPELSLNVPGGLGAQIANALVTDEVRELAQARAREERAAAMARDARVKSEADARRERLASEFERVRLRQQELLETDIRVEKPTENADKQEKLNALIYDTIGALEREQEVVFLTNQERQLRLELMNLEAEATKIGAENVDELTRSYEQNFRALMQAQELKNLADGIGQAFSETFLDIVLGVQSVEEAMRRLMLTIARMVLEQTIAQPLSQIISGTITSLAGGLIPGAGAFASRGIPRVPVVPFAEGGIVNKPTVGLVGEAGPELIVPLRDPGGKKNLQYGGVLRNLTNYLGLREGRDTLFELIRQGRTGQGIADGAGLPLNLFNIFRNLQIPELANFAGGAISTNPLGSLGALSTNVLGSVIGVASQVLPALTPKLFLNNPVAGLGLAAFNIGRQYFTDVNAGVPRLQRGGILQGATVFQSGNRQGLAGEAGPEAVLPLTRGPNGVLGVANLGGASGGPTVINMQVVTPDADSFRKSKRQIFGEIRRASR